MTAVDLVTLAGWLGLDTTGLEVSPWGIARLVLIFLGVPLVAGYLTRRFGEQPCSHTVTGLH